MKKILFFIAICLTVFAYSCTSNEDEFVIQGTVPQERLNGNRIFLVPCDPNSMMLTSKEFEDSIGVDSVVIQDGKFEFRGKGTYLARITVDRKVRFGTQDLLVVAEPGGVITVVIDSVSHGGGTPQNEALEKWKSLKIAHDDVVWNQSRHRDYLQQTGDTAYAAALTDSIHQFNEAFRAEMVDMAKLLGSGPVHDLLINRYSH